MADRGGRPVTRPPLHRRAIERGVDSRASGNDGHPGRGPTVRAYQVREWARMDWKPARSTPESEPQLTNRKPCATR